MCGHVVIGSRGAIWSHHPIQWMGWNLSSKEYLSKLSPF